MTNVYDAIIVGGGPAGATSALLLANAGWKVAVIEKAQFPRRKVCGEFISETSWPLLAKLGVANDLIRVAGPVVRRVGVFAGTRVITSRLAAACDGVGGRAVAREQLDTLLLQRARAAGAEILQPWTLAALAKESDYYDCCITQKGSGRIRQLHSRLIIAAHGSWEHGVLPTNRRRIQPARRIYLASKRILREARFHRTSCR